ncbi:MAG TPA: hypothetical protein GXX75_03175 [Clostridiales bacterium]|nr:hypothetical protein [Clostridiales bacterium]
MARGIYVGVGGTARKAKKIYVGVDGVARKVRKIYVGVGGVARLTWSGYEFSRHTGNVTGTTEPNARNMGSASNGAYAVFAGGLGQYGTFFSVDAYNASLVKTTAPSLHVARALAHGTSIGNYAFFPANGMGTAYGDAYNQSLTRTLVPQDGNYTGQCAQQNSLTNPAFAVVGFGTYRMYPYTKQGSTDIIDTSLVKTTVYASDNAGVGTACIGGNVLLAGGSIKGNPAEPYSDTVYSVNPSYVRTQIASLSSPAKMTAGICNDSFALFVGNNKLDNPCIIEGYNASLVKLTPFTFGNATINTFTAIDGYIQHPEFAAFQTIGLINLPYYAYDTSLIRHESPSIGSFGNSPGHRGAFIGDYMILAGGNNASANVVAFNTAG